MNNLTRAQILALLVGTASAAEWTAIQLLNAPSDTENIPDSLQGNDDEDDNQALTTAMSGASCSGNADCENDDEKCGSFQASETDPENFCVNSFNCGQMGRLNGVPFIVQCWDDPEEDETATMPAALEAELDDYLQHLQDMISKDDEDGNNAWDNVQNLIVSSKSNYQDGWWIEGDDDKFTETDKPRDNRCYYSDTQCPPTDDEPDIERCCMQYPDTNSRRCQPKSLAGTTFYVGPALVVGRCEPDQPTDDEDEAPDNAQDDIAEGSLTTASEKLGEWHDDQKDDAKENAEYDDMTEAEKEEWDEDYEAQKEKREELYAELRTTIGYENCDTEAQAFFEEELLQWEKDVFELCSDTPKDIACQDAYELATQEATARAGDPEDEESKNYYCEMTEDERADYKQARISEVRASESSLAAAWMEANAPGAGDAGSSCATLKCTDPSHCCGTSTLKIGANVNDPLEDICADETSLEYEDGLGREYTHVCNSESFAKLTTAASAAFAAVVGVYTLM